jgi:hypothetical protein
MIGIVTPAFFIDMGSPELFLLKLAWNLEPISASQVARIPGVSHWSPTGKIYFLKGLFSYNYSFPLCSEAIKSKYRHLKDRPNTNLLVTSFPLWWKCATFFL